ncbi:hypothetical protein Bca4012_079056 [Brassica carinata]|uniref:Protein kinase domain-containing protein n=1 Tax=Brassica carinata TaxID=52824 RepID=A0A8X7NWT2_BRACI|nr:hypothetical protein Bca52824_091844 [Brassica carinata]
MCGLRHPHIVLLSEVLDTKTKKIFVMELAKGGELFSRVSSNRFTEGLSRKYFKQLISAVRYCHARGVHHSDLKPENLLLDENRDLKATCRFEIQTSRDSTGESEWLNTPCRSGLLRRLLEPVPEKRITVEEILKDPWFNHGVDPSEIVGVQIDDYDLEEETKRVRVDRVVVHPESRRLFVSDESPAEIMRKVVEVARQLNLRIAKKKERAVKLEGSQGVAKSL